LYDPAAPGAPGRLALLEYLASIGATLEDFKLVGPNELPAVASLVRLFPNRELLTLEEAAARAGASPDFVRRVWRAAGFADAETEQLLLSADVDMFESLTVAIDVFGEENTLQMVRVLGACAARLADAAISMFVSNTAPIAAQKDPTLVELARERGSDRHPPVPRRGLRSAPSSPPSCATPLR
jgi:hypothetical protein